MSEQTYHAISKLTEWGTPLLGDAEVILGDGSSRVSFKNGRAVLTAAQAEMLQNRGDIDIVGFDPAKVEAQAVEDAKAAETTAQTEGSTSEEFTMSGAQEGVTTLTQANQSPSAAADNVDLELAKEHLREEGEEVPETETAETTEEAVKVPAGFSLKTDEGEDRCLAAKGDGEQCANAAVGDTHACGIAKHKEQVQA